MLPQQSLIPVVMSGIIAVYALVIAVLIASDIGPPPGQNYSLFKYEYLGGLYSIANGFSVGSCILRAVYQ
jgi:V-type H+-transporting ATPase proteolipid subunit